MHLKSILNFLTIINSAIIISGYNNNNTENEYNNYNLDDIFNGVYTECFMHLSYLCLQKKTLLYLDKLNNLNEVSVFGDYVKFVKLNTTHNEEEEEKAANNTEELTFMIDKAIDKFFDNHVLKFNALGKDVIIPRNVNEFVGRKKRKGGGGGHMGDDGHKKKMMMMAMMCMKMKLMMMVPAMMGMMGMMSFKGMMFSMMSFMISKMMLLMKILEKKGLGGASAAAGDGGWMAASGGGAWMPAGGQDYGGGYDANGQWQSRSLDNNTVKPIIYKPINGKDRDNKDSKDSIYKIPVLVYKKSNVNFKNNNVDEDLNVVSVRIKRDLKYYNKELRADGQVFGKANNVDEAKKVDSVIMKRDLNYYKVRDEKYDNDDKYNIKQIYLQRLTSMKEKGKNRILNKEENFKNILIGVATKDLNDKRDTVLDKSNKTDEGNSNFKPKSRKKRGLIDLIQNSYIYWINKILGLNNNRRTAFQKYKIVNGIKYVYYPNVFRVQNPKAKQLSDLKNLEGFRPIAVEDFNKGEIMESAQSRMNHKKLIKVKDTANEVVADDPWQ